MKQILYFIAFCLAFIACKKGNDAPAPVVTPPVAEPFIPPVFGADTLGPWQKMSTGEFYSLSMVSAAKGFTAALLAQGWGIFKTTDSGKTWTGIKPLPQFYGTPYIVFASETNGFWSARDMQLGYMPFFELYKQPSSSLYNQELRLSIPSGPARYFFPETICVNDTMGYTITDAGYLTRFTIRAPNLFFYTNLVNIDYGGTAINDVKSGSNIAFANAAVGGVVKNTAKNGITKSYLRTTIDSGKTWNRITAIGADDISHLSFLDANTLLAMGKKNRLYRSNDGGATWASFTVPGTNSWPYNASVFVSPVRGFVAKLNEIYETNDGGASWMRSCKVGYYTDGTGAQRNNEFNDLQAKGGFLWSRTKNSIVRFKL